jgi:thioesterase domain-containing protein
MARLVEERSGDQPTAGSSQTTLVPLRAEGSRPPVFLVHAIGGSAVPYLPLAELLDPAQPVYAFEARGLHGPADRAGATIASLARDYLAELRGVQPHGPYRLGGWSVGGVIAQQIAGQLRAAGDQVALLALLDSVPGEPGDQVADPAGLLSWFARDLVNLRGQGLPGLNPELLRAVPATDQLPRAVDHLVEHGVIEGEDRAAIATRFEVFAELATAFLLHRPAAVDCPTELLVTADTAPLATSRWRAVGGQFNLHQVPGDHYSMLQQPQLNAVAAVLGRLLDQACR